MTATKVELAETLVAVALNFLSSRKGFDHWWFNLEEEISKELEAEFVVAMTSALEEHRGKVLTA